MTDGFLQRLKDIFKDEEFVVFDIGASSLNQSINIRNEFPNSRIYAFECNEYWLNKHSIEMLAAINAINYYQIAISDTVGKTTYYPCNHNHGQPWPMSSSICKPNKVLYDLGLEWETETIVDSTTIENFCAEKNIFPDFICVDTQGAEYKILSKLGQCRPKVIWAKTCEFANYQTGTTVDEFNKFMDFIGYIPDLANEVPGYSLYVNKNIVVKPRDINNATNKKINFVFNNIKNIKINQVHLAANSKEQNFELLHGKEIGSLGNELRKINLIQEHSEDNLPDETFIFEYEHHWWFPVENFFNLDDGGFLSKCPPSEKILERIKEKTAHLVITIPFESPITDYFLNIIHNYFAKFNLPYTQIHYLTNSPNGNSIYGQYCVKHGLQRKFNIHYFPMNVRIHADSAKTPKFFNSDYSTNSREKTFLTFNRRWANHAHRVLLLYYVYKYNLQNSVYASFSKIDVDSNSTFTDVIKYSFDYIKNETTDELDFPIIDKIENDLPLVLDRTDLASSSLMFDEFETTKSFYDNSMVHLTSETYFFSEIIHITEKTYKPILYKQPFIILAAPNFLKHLRQLGFKTFEEVWDESYDDCENHTERFFKIINLVRRIHSDPNKELIMEKCKPIIEFNFNYMIKNYKNLYINLIGDIL